MSGRLFPVTIWLVSTGEAITRQYSKPSGSESAFIWAEFFFAEPEQTPQVDQVGQFYPVPQSRNFATDCGSLHTNVWRYELGIIEVGHPTSDSPHLSKGTSRILPSKLESMKPRSDSSSGPR